MCWGCWRGEISGDLDILHGGYDLTSNGFLASGLLDILDFIYIHAYTYTQLILTLDSIEDRNSRECLSYYVQRVYEPASIHHYS